MLSGRALHYVFKVFDRKATASFYQNILGMKVLRHEEFTEGCAAACNGPYDNRWSKTMVGYGPEDTHFVVELTYNYNVHSYKMGNDFVGITIKSSDVYNRVQALPDKIEKEGNMLVTRAPGGYTFFILNEPEVKGKDPVEKVTLACSDLSKSLNYWKDLLNLQCFSQTSDTALLGFSENQAKLELKCIGSPIKREEAYGRIAFSTPYANLAVIEKKMIDNKMTILTPLTSLDTPGKATVTVVILADPDGHEICFVDDENFRKLSAVDPEATDLLNRYIKKDDERMASTK